MMDQFSSLAGVRPPRAHSIVGEWRDYAGFLRRPWVPDRATGPDGRSLLATLRLLLLDFALMAVLMAIGGIAYAAGVEFPENALESLEWTPGVLLLIVLGAPVMEEVMFRGWLSGRLGHVLATIVAVPALAMGSTVLAFDAVGGPGEHSIVLIPAAAAMLLVAFAIVYALRHRGAARWFTRVFPLFFWLSALAFATIHIWNYPDDPGPLVLALVIPQLIAGTIFGYARVRYGLWSSILLHALHNGTAVTLALLTTDVMR